MSFGTEPEVFFLQRPPGSWRVQPCSYGTQPGIVCSGHSAGGILQQKANIFGWFLMDSMWIHTVGPITLEFFHYLTYSSPRELDSEIRPNSEDT